MSLDLSSLEKAIDSLERALKVSNVKIKGKVNTDYEEVIRAGVIQNFEFTYELCWKFMKRWLETNAGRSDVDGVTRKELFRLAAESRLIRDVISWFKYHDARNQTAHTYDSKKAGTIYKIASKFLKDAKILLNNVKEKND
ncbi:MAG: nucleotidyltransferase [Elusimicrobia bacterium RIFOXYD2_FULL_34_15]|nr:MAG: nucleotidyltransferase [Elusimicrobia bacterium RIFOXYD2_FULL_34_15]